MKLTWKGTYTNQVGFHVEELAEYDAEPPVRSMLLDHGPTHKNPEREAIAAYLAFGRWASGDFVLPRKHGPNTARAIENDMKHVPLRPQPIEYYPKPLDIGIRTIDLWFTPDRIGVDNSISILPGAQWNGSIRTTLSLAVASNAHILDSSGIQGRRSVRARLAAAVLFADDLSADVLRIHPDAPVDEAEQARLSDLLGAARLGVEFID